MDVAHFLFYMFCTLNSGFWVGMVVARFILERRYEFVERKTETKS